MRFKLGIACLFFDLCRGNSLLNGRQLHPGLLERRPLVEALFVLEQLRDKNVGIPKGKVKVIHVSEFLVHILVMEISMVKSLSTANSWMKANVRQLLNAFIRQWARH